MTSRPETFTTEALAVIGRLCARQPTVLTFHALRRVRRLQRTIIVTSNGKLYRREHGGWRLAFTSNWHTWRPLFSTEELWLVLEFDECVSGFWVIEPRDAAILAQNARKAQRGQS
jgi:hypothetical protein